MNYKEYTEMKTLIDKNKEFTRSIYSGSAERHGFVCHPQQIPVYEKGDYTLF